MDKRIIKVNKLKVSKVAIEELQKKSKDALMLLADEAINTDGGDCIVSTPCRIIGTGGILELTTESQIHRTKIYTVGRVLYIPYIELPDTLIGKGIWSRFQDRLKEYCKQNEIDVIVVESVGNPNFQLKLVREGFIPIDLNNAVCEGFTGDEVYKFPPFICMCFDVAGGILSDRD